MINNLQFKHKTYFIFKVYYEFFNMNILFLSQFFSSTKGGGEYLFYTMAKKIADNGHQVWVITNKIENEEYPLHENIRIVFVQPTLRYQGGLPPSFKDNLRYLVNSIKAGRKIIKKNDIDIIHSNNFTPSLSGSILAFLTSTFHITSVWDIFTLCGCDYWKKWVKQSGVSKINQFLGPIFEKLVIKAKCDAIHTISNASRDDLLEFGAKKPIYVIAPAIEEIKNKNKTQNNKQFIYVGRLVFYKNVEILINAMEIVKNVDDEIKLIIVGGGPQFKILKDLIEKKQLAENIIIKNYVSTEEKFKLISESNAMLFPSLCEGFGLVILEAFSQNKPVLVSNLKPMSDIISDGETGFILNSNDAELWAKNIIHLSKDTQISQKMGRNGNDLLKTKYNQDKMYQKIIKMYKDVTKS